MMKPIPVAFALMAILAVCSIACPAPPAGEEPEAVSRRQQCMVEIRWAETPEPVQRLFLAEGRPWRPALGGEVELCVPPLYSAVGEGCPTVEVEE
jgi:hypothetical protein